MLSALFFSSSQTFDRCNALGICQVRHSFRNILDDLQDGVADYIKRMVKEGKEIRWTFENFDFRILTNIVISGYKNSDMHWICQYITFDRVPSSHLDDTKRLVTDLTKLENKEYLLSKNELEKMWHEYIVLVSRVLLEFFPCLKVIKNVVPPHIEHRFSKEMAEKSEIINMPVVPFNQNKTSDICRYMEYVTDFLYNIYRGLNADDTTDLDGSDETSSLADVAAKKSEVLQDVKVPLVGDLLGRERLTGAKKTRAGCDHSADRFEQIVELPAVWHAKQFFLSVSEVFGARAKVHTV
jgi:hypothetical protein